MTFIKIYRQKEDIQRKKADFCKVYFKLVFQEK